MVIAQAKPIAKNISPESEASDGKVRMTLEEYRSIAETSEERYEYCNGEIIAMTGGSSAHSCIVVDITTFLNIAVRKNNNDRWQLQICDRLEQTIHLQSLNLELPMSEIYRRIKF